MANFDHSNVAIFNKSQFDPGNRLFELEDFAQNGAKWVGELGSNMGEDLASVVLVGPITTESPVDRAKWRAIEITGEGRATAIVWVDNRKVSQGFLRLGDRIGRPFRLNIPKDKACGYSCSAMVVFMGVVRGVEIFYDPMSSAGEP